MSTHMRDSPIRTRADTATAGARVAPQLGVVRRRQHGLDLAQHAEALLIDRRDRSLVGHLRVAQRMNRTIHPFGQGRRVEVAEHRAAVGAGAAHDALTPREIDEKPLHRFRNLLQRQAAAPRAKLRARPIDFRRAQVAGVELMNKENVEVFLLDRPCLRGGARRGKSHRLAIALHFAGAEVGAVQLRSSVRGSSART